MIDKRVSSLAAAVLGIADGSTILISGFGGAGVPFDLVDALVATGATDLTIVANNAGFNERGVATLLREGRLRKLVCSFPRGSKWFERRYEAGDVELELVPQGTLSERIRAGGAGIGGFYTPTGAGTLLARGKEERLLDGRRQILELPISADVALVKAHLADRWGNLVYRLTARNFGPTMAMAARLTIVEVDRFVELGDLDPDRIVTPGIFVDRVVALDGESTGATQ